MRNLEGVIKGLGHLWKIFAEGKLSDDMGKVHDCEVFCECSKREMVTRTAVVDMDVTTVAMADGSDVKIC
jgi:hypothetical protein